MHNDLVSPVHREINVNVGFQPESSEMMERDGEPLERIVKMRKRTISFLPLFETPNLPGIPVGFLVRQPGHAVLPLQHFVHLPMKVEILFCLSIVNVPPATHAPDFFEIMQVQTVSFFVEAIRGISTVRMLNLVLAISLRLLKFHVITDRPMLPVLLLFERFK